MIANVDVWRFVVGMLALGALHLELVLGVLAGAWVFTVAGSCRR